MDKNLTVPGKHLIKMDTGEDLLIDEKHMEKTTNEAGVKLWKYRYWLIRTKDHDYKITDPDEYKQFLKSVSNPSVRFIKVAKDAFVNIAEIRSFGEKAGFCARGGEDVAH